MTDETRSLIYNCDVTSDDAQRICEILWFERGPVNELHERAGGATEELLAELAVSRSH